MNRIPLVLLILTVMLSGKILYDKTVLLEHNQEQYRELVKLKDKVREIEDVNAENTRENTRRLEELRATYEDTITGMHVEYNDRMYELEDRAIYYRSLSETSSAECRDLSDIATRFDRNLEEGRRLVIELRERLLFREEQIRVIGRQMLADRQLLGQVE